MTTTPESTKGVPRIEGDPAPTLRADHNALADWVRDNMNPQVANEAALAGLAFSWLGRVVIAADTGIEYRYTGSAWRRWNSPWLTYTPTYTNLTVGAGPVAKYRFVNGMVQVKLRLPVASMGSNPTISTPMTMSDALTEHLAGTVGLIPGAGSEVVGVARKGSSNNQVTFYYHFISGTTVYINNVAASAPFAWSTTGTIAATFWIEPA